MDVLTSVISGIMRITVTVVVIMFELTGALTYILPTMVSRICFFLRRHSLTYKRKIVLLATKAVGDFLGVNGIADEMIRFNGYPFLEKSDHAFHTEVASVMRTELHTLKASGMTVEDVGEYS